MRAVGQRVRFKDVLQKKQNGKPVKSPPGPTPTIRKGTMDDYMRKGGAHAEISDAVSGETHNFAEFIVKEPDIKDSLKNTLRDNHLCPRHARRLMKTFDERQAKKKTKARACYEGTA